MMFRKLTIFVMMLGLTTASLADVPRPDSILQTLGLLNDAIHAAAPDLPVTMNTADISLNITLPDGEDYLAYPDNLYLNLQNAVTAAAREEVLARHVTGLLDSIAAASEAADRDLDLDQVMPILRPERVLTDSPIAGLPHQPFPGGLVVYWVIDSETQTASISDEVLQDSGLGQSDLAARAILNLQSRMKDLQQKDLGSVTLLVLDGYFESSVMLLPEVWQDIDRRIGTVIAAPIARDLVIFFDGDDAATTVAMRGYVLEQYATAAYAISADLFRWDKDHWTLLP